MNNLPNLQLSTNAILWLQNYHDLEADSKYWQHLSNEEKNLLKPIRENLQTIQIKQQKLENENLELHKSLSFIQTAIKSLDIPIFIKDNLEAYYFVNDSFANFFNSNPTDFVGKKINQTALSSEIQEVIYNEDKALIENLTNLHQEISLPFEEAVKQCWYWATGFQDKYGTSGLVGNFIDLSKLIEKNSELNNQVLELSLEKKQVETLAVTDPLTGLYNKLSLNLHTQRQIRAKELYDTNFSAIMFDIDHFKLVNDNYGHLEGDEVLRKTGQLILGSTRKIDICIRYGGEEFLILLPGTPFDNAKIFAQRLCYIFPNKIFKSDGSPVTISIGVTEYILGEPIDDFIRRVDSYLYEAKRGGRNQVVAKK